MNPSLPQEMETLVPGFSRKFVCSTRQSTDVMWVSTSALLGYTKKYPDRGHAEFPLELQFYSSHCLDTSFTNGGLRRAMTAASVASLVVDTDTKLAEVEPIGWRLHVANDLKLPFFPVRVQFKRVISPAGEVRTEGWRHVKHLTFWQVQSVEESHAGYHVSDAKKRKAGGVALHYNFTVTMRMMQYAFIEGSWKAAAEFKGSQGQDPEYFPAVGREVVSNALRNGHWLSRTELETTAAYLDCPVLVMAGDEITEYLQEYGSQYEGLGLAIVNTADNNRGGEHWILVLWCEVQGDVKVHVVDPMQEALLCEPVLANLRAGGFDVTATGVGFQRDGWRCGYYSLFMAWGVTRLGASRFEEVILYKMPPTFTSTVWFGVVESLTWSGGPMPAVPEQEVATLFGGNLDYAKLK